MLLKHNTEIKNRALFDFLCSRATLQCVYNDNANQMASDMLIILLYLHFNMKSCHQSVFHVFSVCVSMCLCLSQLESAGRMLKVTEARLEDSGRYTCLATNAAGEAQQHIRLSVHGN